MRTINFLFQSVFKKTVLASSLLVISGFVMVQDDHAQHDMQTMDAPSSSADMTMMDMPEMDHSQMDQDKMNHAEMDHSQMNHAETNHNEMDHSQMSHSTSSETVDHSQHKNSVQPSEKPLNQHAQHQHSKVNAQESDHSETNLQGVNHKEKNHEGHDHRAEHGGQVYAVTTFDNKWLLNKDGNGALKSELETRIGNDENKLFIKIHVDKHESQDAEFDAKVMYSRMISDFWDAQAGVRYRSEKVDLDRNYKDTEEKLDGVIGLHGLAPYFFETDAYIYVGEDNYSGFSFETERDLLLTQKLIFKPYWEVDVVFSDDSKYAKKSGFSNVTAGIETRYEISKKVMPYLDIAYEYSKGNAATNWQVESDADSGWLYGAGVRFKF